MAANQPAGGNRTVALKDKVIDSRITKKAKQKTMSKTSPQLPFSVFWARQAT